MDIVVALATFTALYGRCLRMRLGDLMVPEAITEELSEVAAAIVGWVDGGGYVPEGSEPMVGYAREVARLLPLT